MVEELEKTNCPLFWRLRELILNSENPQTSMDIILPYLQSIGNKEKEAGIVEIQ